MNNESVNLFTEGDSFYVPGNYEDASNAELLIRSVHGEDLMSIVDSFSHNPVRLTRGGGAGDPMDRGYPRRILIGAAIALLVWNAVTPGAVF